MNSLQDMAQVTMLLAILCCQCVAAFSWSGGDHRIRLARNNIPMTDPSGSVSHLLSAASRLPTSYDLALQELRELESEPLCHRTAARLLVNNCQLLEGKDEATVLTDSGRKIRDFVDSYAASLAICDLERGSFEIPRECAQFRESALTQLPLQDTANLHVTSREIDNCLSGLGASDSAWNTWVSYRHKALRFCEAARADNDKVQNILLFQRLTKIMSKLADDVDNKFEKRMNDIDLRAQATGDKINSLTPQLDHLQGGLKMVEDLVSGNILEALKRSTDSVNSGIENAANLQRMLEVILQGVINSHAEVANVHETSMARINEHAESEMNTMIAVMATALASAANLQNQMEISRLQATELESRQDNLEQGMQRLIDITEGLSTKYEDHTALLQQAQNITVAILDSLEDTAASAALVGEAFLGQSASASWWPYIWCPAASLVMGSYGLQPSILRNVGLIALGEGVGFIMASIQSLSFDISQFTMPIFFSTRYQTNVSTTPLDTKNTFDNIPRPGLI